MCCKRFNSGTPLQGSTIKRWIQIKNLTSTWNWKTIVQLEHNTLDAMFNLVIIGTSNEDGPFVGVTIG